MTDPQMMQAVVADYHRARLAEAARARLIAAATCCRQSRLGRAAARVRAGVRAAVTPRPAACCA